ncbi:RNA-directed DNA polymerase [Streptomyces sp. MN03-5084-2B]|nr:RNA-directed DNA polymerase [Streptomyces sp. MN03-5084-2B]
MPAEMVENLDLKLAAQQEGTASRNLLPPEPWQDILVVNSEKFADWVSLRLKAGAKNHPGVIVSAKKPRQGIRPVPVIGIAERIAYRALTAYILSNIPEPQRSADDYRNFVGGPIWASFPKGTGLRRLGDATAKYVVEADVTAFYQYIDHDILLEELYLQTSKVTESQYLSELVGEVQGASFGLPQLLDPSDRLSEAYINIATRDVVRRGIQVWRYNDDIRVTAKSYNEALSRLETISTSVAKIGLVLNEGKTNILKFFTYFINNVDNAPDDEEAQINPSDIPLTTGNYPDLDAEEIVDEARSVVQSVRIDSKDKGIISLKGLNRDDARRIRRSITALTLSEDPSAFSIVVNVMLFAPDLTPRVSEYLVALSKAEPALVEATWDELTTKHDEVLSEWQKIWLVYVARSIGILNSKPARRVAWMKKQLEKSNIEALHAEASLTLSTIGEIDFEQLDTSLRVRPEPLSPWYVLGIKNLDGLGKVDSKMLQAVKDSATMYQLLIEG